MTSIPKPARRSPKSRPIHLEFDDNNLLALLCGEHDAHLAQIEKQLGVTLAPKGNRVSISGPTDAVEAVRTALEILYDRLKKGLDVDRAEVDAAVRLANGADASGGRFDVTGVTGGELMVRTNKRPISPRSPGQATYIQALRDFELVFGLGPAGTGKTYLAAAIAVSMLQSGRVERLILSRPAVEAGERLGFLPGDLRDKVDPYLRPLYDALFDMLPAEQVMRRIETGEIEIAPLAFMRGRTLSNAYVILDEAQNATPMQMKMLLTRLGENSRMAVTGDLSQIDLPGGATSGLQEAVDILAGMEGVAFVHFTDADVVRHLLVSRIVRAYGEREAALKSASDAARTDRRDRSGGRGGAT